MPQSEAEVPGPGHGSTALLVFQLSLANLLFITWIKCVQ